MLPWHVYPLVPPQVASVETVLVPVAVGAEVVDVVVGLVLPLLERYQLAESSPRHSPTVTAL